MKKQKTRKFTCIDCGVEKTIVGKGRTPKRCKECRAYKPKVRYFDCERCNKSTKVKGAGILPKYCQDCINEFIENRKTKTKCIYCGSKKEHKHLLCEWCKIKGIDSSIGAVAFREKTDFAKYHQEYRKDAIENFKRKVRGRTYRSVQQGKIDNSYCRSCGATENIECHHTEYRLDSPTWTVIPLCKKCHGLYHRGDRRR